MVPRSLEATLEAALVVARSTACIPLIVVCECLSRESQKFIIDQGIHVLLLEYEGAIYKHLYSWLHSTEISFDNVFKELFHVVGLDTCLIYRLVTEISHIVSEFGKIEAFIDNLFDFSQNNCKLPCELGLYKLRFVNGYHVMQMAEKLDLLLNYQALVAEHQALYTQRLHFDRVDQFYYHVHTRDAKSPGLSERNLKQAIKMLERGEVVMEESLEEMLTETSNASHAQKRLVEILRFLKDSGVNKNINASMDRFHRLIHTTPESMYHYHNLTSTEFRAALGPRNITNELALQWLIEAKLLYDFGMKQDACERLLSFLYTSFKSGDIKFMCLCLCHAIHIIVSIEPLDAGFHCLLRDLIEKAETHHQARYLTYGKFVQSLYDEDSHLWKTMQELVSSATVDYEHILLASVYRCYFWSVMGFTTTSISLLGSILNIFLNDPSLCKSIPKIYESCVCIQAYNLFTRGEFGNAMSLLKNFIAEKNGNDKAKKAINCLARIHLEAYTLGVSSTIVGDNYEYLKHTSAVDSLGEETIFLGDYPSAAVKLDFEISDLHKAKHSWRKRLHCVRSLYLMSVSYYQCDRVMVSMKTAIKCCELASREKLYYWGAKSLLLISKSLLQLYQVDTAIPFLSLLIKRFFSFLSSHDRAETLMILSRVQLCYSHGTLSPIFGKSAASLLEDATTRFKCLQCQEKVRECEFLAE